MMLKQLMTRTPNQKRVLPTAIKTDTSAGTAQEVSRVKLGDFNSRVGMERGASTIKEVGWYLVKMFFFLSAFPYPQSLKRALLRMFNAKVGRGVIIKPRVNIHFPWKLEVGNDVWIGEEVFILNFESVVIGNNVCVSQRAFLCGGNHDYRVPSMPYRNGPIILNDGCWIGACCFIGPNVTVGIDTVVTAGSVITSSVTSNKVCGNYRPISEKFRWY